MGGGGGAFSLPFTQNIPEILDLPNLFVADVQKKLVPLHLEHFETSVKNPPMDERVNMGSAL